MRCWGPVSGNYAAPSVKFIQISVGILEENICGVTSSGAVKCWSWKNQFGQAKPPAGTFSQVSAGATHNCGVTKASKVTCWGDNTEGQRQTQAGTFSQVSAGAGHT